jgi:hypothetical protein
MKKSILIAILIWLILVESSIPAAWLRITCYLLLAVLRAINTAMIRLVWRRVGAPKTISAARS